MPEQLLKPEIESLIARRRPHELRQRLDGFDPGDVAELLETLSREDALIAFRSLPRASAAAIFEHLSHDKQVELVEDLAPDSERLASLLNDLSPDDRTAFFAELPEPDLQHFLSILDPKERASAVRLLGYPEESVGRLATTDYIAIRPHWTVEQALRHVRRFGRDSETINVIYIVDRDWKLLDDVRIREIILAEPETTIQSLMDGRFVALVASDDQETAVAAFRESDRTMLPVIDPDGVLVGIVTADDVLDVAEEEATEDIQKLGGLEALETPYMDTPLPSWYPSARVGWPSCSSAKCSPLRPWRFSNRKSRGPWCSRCSCRW